MHCWPSARSQVHGTGIPWNDPSGDRLRNWLGLTPVQFYDPRKVAIIPMGFCYPGKAASGDNPPRPECAPRWHAELNAHLPDMELTLLIGQICAGLLSPRSPQSENGRHCAGVERIFASGLSPASASLTAQPAMAC
jgi:uracil-DNA glycosylase